MATPAHSLVVLRNEVDREHPGRDKHSDGWIGDTRHNSSGRPENGGSKHNPNRRNVVDARDFDSSALDVARFVAAVIRHPSTRNVIYNRKIRSRAYSGGLKVAHAYHGPSPHTEHVHVDIEMTVQAENDGRAWGYYRGGTKPAVVPGRKPADSKVPAGGMTKLPTLRRNAGKQRAAVKTLQRALVKAGFPVGSTGADGRFGPGTFKAVRAFQRRYKLGADGEVGPRTWVALAQALLARAGRKVTVDGDFGPKTAAAVFGFQKSTGQRTTAVVDGGTWTKLITAKGA